ncbi:unnamed protein product, partial [Lymnaea stagnalis]
ITKGQTPLNDHAAPVKPKTYSVLFAAVAATLSAIIFIFGLLGNILVVIVIARTRSMHTTTNCYLLSLAVADSLVLLSGTLPAIPEPFYRVDEWPYGRIMCPTLIFLQYLGVDSSSLSITAFTIERYIAICHPMKAHTMCTVSRAKKIIAILWIFTLLYCSPWLGLTEIKRSISVNNETVEYCHFRFARSSYLVLYMIDLILFYVIPLIIATVLYLLIGRILYLSRALRKNDRVPKRRSPKKRADSRVQVGMCTRLNCCFWKLFPVSFLSLPGMRSSSAFASLWMPYRVMVVYNSFAKSAYIDLWFLLFARTMIYVNCAINPVLYNIMSVKFKRAFRNLLSCCHRHESLPGNNFSDVGTDVWATRRQTVSLQHQQLNQVLQQHTHHHNYSASNGSKRGPFDNGLAQVSTGNVSGPVGKGLGFGPAGQYQ